MPYYTFKIILSFKYYIKIISLNNKKAESKFLIISEFNLMYYTIQPPA